MKRIAVDGSAVTDGVHIGNVGLLLQINAVGSASLGFLDVSLAQRCIGAETNGHDDEVHLVLAFVGDDAADSSGSAAALDFLNHLAVVELHAAFFQHFVHIGAELFIVIGGKTRILRFKQKGLFPSALHRFGKFHSDVTGSHNGDTIDLRIVEFAVDTLPVLEQFDAFHTGQIQTGQFGDDGQRSRC